MQIGVSLKGAVTEENYNNSLICMARINFRPSSAIVGVISNLTFVKVKPRYTKEGGEDLTDWFLLTTEYTGINTEFIQYPPDEK